MTFLCCFRSSVRPIDSADPSHLAPEDIEEKERQERIARCHTCTRLNDGRLIVQGVLQRANAKNRNGRVYPKDTLKREADRYYITHVKPGKAFGELDHPDSNSAMFRSLDGTNVSHQVLDYWWEGDDLIGVVEVLPTAKGEVLKAYFLVGRKLGVSSRGWATLQDNNDGKGIFIQNDFELITFDFVSDPSTEGAYLLPLTWRYQKLKPMPDLSAFDTLFSHPLPPTNGGKQQGALKPPPKAASNGARSSANGKYPPVGGAGDQRANSSAPMGYDENSSIAGGAVAARKPNSSSAGAARAVTAAASSALIAAES